MAPHIREAVIANRIKNPGTRQRSGMINIPNMEPMVMKKVAINPAPNQVMAWKRKDCIA
jgi:hypothetical protein